MITFDKLKKDILPKVADKRDANDFQTDMRSRHQDSQSPAVTNTKSGLIP